MISSDERRKEKGHPGALGNSNMQRLEKNEKARETKFEKWLVREGKTGLQSKKPWPGAGIGESEEKEEKEDKKLAKTGDSRKPSCNLTAF